MAIRILIGVAFFVCNRAYTLGMIDGWILIYCGIIIGSLIIRD